MTSLYDRADIYDLLETEERYQITKRHWERVLSGKEIGTLLDVSIGSGNLTLPLAELGVRLYGSDLSESMLKKCGEKAEKRGIPIDLRTCDFRKLDEKFDTAFDCVASTGNSLPYVTNGELLDVLSQMDRLVKPGGYLYIDIRNWDRILETKQRFYLYNPTFLDDGVRVNLVQAWDYHEDDSMTFNLLYTFERDNRIFQKEIFEEHYFPVKRRVLLDGLKRLGYVKIEMLCLPAFLDVKPEEAGWYCVIAQKGEALP